MKDAFEEATNFSSFKRWLEATTIITNLMKGGVSAKEMHEIVDEVEETLSGGHIPVVQQDHTTDVSAQPLKPGEGHLAHVQSDQERHADARPPMPEGHVDSVQQDHLQAADGLPIAEGGQTNRASESQHVNASLRDPISEPGGQSSGEAYLRPAPSARDHLHISRNGGLASVNRSIIHNQAPSAERMRAVREAGHTSVATIFDRFTLPDGRRIGDIRTNEYGSLAASHVRFASLFLRLKDCAFRNNKTGPGVLTRELLTAKQLEKMIADSGVINLDNEIKGGILIEQDGTMSFIRKAAS